MDRSSIYLDQLALKNLPINVKLLNYEYFKTKQLEYFSIYQRKYSCCNSVTFNSGKLVKQELNHLAG